MSDYNLIKNAAILVPTGNVDLGTNTNPLANIYMSGNLNLGNTTVTGENVLTPRISNVDYPNDATAASLTGNETIILNGSGFQPGLGVYIDNTIVAVSTVLSSTQISFVTPSKAAGNYNILVINPDGATGSFIPGITYSALPVWSTSAGSIANVYELQSVSANLSASSDSNVTYNAAANTLPSGISLNSSTGVISGTAPSQAAGSTTYSFAITAEDVELQDAPRTFSITVNADSVTWSQPSANANVALDNGTAYTLNLSATSASGRTVTYTANTLPTGLTLSNGVVSGTPNTNQTISTLYTATESVSGKSAQRLLNYTVTTPVVEATGGTVTTSGNFKIHTFTGSGTFSVTKKPAGKNIDVLVVAGGGGGGSSNNAGPGGGGAGGLIYQINVATFTIANYTVTVGAGGPTGSLNGSNSSVSGTGVSYTAIGGGRGGGASNGAPGSGGSGGGAMQNQTAGTGTAGQGFSGGSSTSSDIGAGGGGANQAGADSIVNGGNGSGGNGRQINITGTNVYYAGGGGGGGSSGAAGGLGGGGSGGGGRSPSEKYDPGNGGTNLGGGAGGGRTWDGSAGATGGSGVVIFRYQYQ